MIVDTSALVAIARAEPEARQYVEAMRDAAPRMSAASVLEAAMVLRPALGDRLDELLREAEIDVVPFDAAQLAEARRAMARYGKGTGAAAKLNFGDCFSYALAKTANEPLLFTGNDFRHTDIEPAITALM